MREIIPYRHEYTDDQKIVLFLLSIALGIIIFFSIAGQINALGFTGTQDTWSPSGLETFSINATNYYLNDVNITDRLTGDWTGIGLISDTINTGHGANELYDMDQHVQTTDDVTFNGVSTNWIDLDGVNRSTWPAGGVGASGWDLDGYDYIIYYNSTTSTYNGLNCETGIIDITNASADYAIKNTWALLTDGGSFRTTGPGETWVFNNGLFAQTDYVTWKSDWSLIFKAGNGLNSNMIEFYYDDYITLDGLNFDGAHDNQTEGDVIYGYESDYISIKNIKIYNAREWGIKFQYCDYPYIGYGIVDGAGENNAITFGAGSRYCKAEYLELSRSGDVGATAYNAYDVVFEDITSSNNRNQLGSGIGDGKASGFTVENSEMVKLIRCIGDNNSQHGFMSNSPVNQSEWVQLIDCDFSYNDEYGVSFWNDVFKHQILGGFYRENGYGDIQVNEGDDCLIDSVFIESASGQDSIEVETADNLRVTNSKFITNAIGLNMNNAGVQGAIVYGNDFSDCTTDVSTNVGGSYHWGYNLDQAGNWEDDVEP